jgi:hypothetical protein
MLPIERVKKHFKQKLSDTERLKIEVPEWGDELENGEIEPFVMYARPETISEREQYIQGVRDGKPSASVDLIIVRCKNASSVNIFKSSQRETMLANADPHIIDRIALQILTWDQEISNTVEDEKKP